MWKSDNGLIETGPFSSNRAFDNLYNDINKDKNIIKNEDSEETSYKCC